MIYSVLVIYIWKSPKHFVAVFNRNKPELFIGIFVGETFGVSSMIKTLQDTVCEENVYKFTVRQYSGAPVL